MTTRTLSRRLRLRAGYTLLEILIVLAIIGLLVAIVGMNYDRIFDGAKVNTAKTEMRGLRSALNVMQLEVGRYPTAAEGLSLLVSAPGDGAPGWNGPYIEGDLPSDPWGNPYVYLESNESGSGPVIMSYGNDGKEGGDGNAADITVN